MQQDQGRSGTVVHDSIDDVRSVIRRVSLLTEQRVQKHGQAMYRGGSDGLQTRGAQRIVSVQTRMELDAGETVARQARDLVDDPTRVGAPGRVDARDRHEALIRGVRAFQDVRIVDDTDEPDQAGPFDPGAVELHHEPRVARIVPAVQPPAAAGDVHERIEARHTCFRGTATALPMAEFPASRFTANSSIQRPANVVQRSGASGSIGSTPCGHAALKYTTSPGSATSSITRSRPSAICTNRPP